MATAVTTFNFATTLQSWSSIAALASGETNGLDTVNGNPADALFGKLVGKTKATTAGAGMKLSQSLTAWGVPAGATVTAVSVALDKKCVTAPGSAIGSGSFNTKLNLNAGASLNTGPTQTLSTTADSVWTTLAAGSNAALSGLTDSTLTHLLEVDILYTLSTTSSATVSTTWQIDWDNVVVTVTYTVNVPTAPGTPTAAALGAKGNLSWTDDANNGGASVTDHHVYTYTAPSGGSPVATNDTVSSSTAYVTPAQSAGTYYYEVTASNTAGESAHSARSGAATISTYAATIGSDAPLAWYRLDEASPAASAADASGNGHTATYASFLAGDYAQPGLTGDGDTAVKISNGAVEAPSLGLLSSSPWTYEEWITAPVTSASGKEVPVGSAALAAGFRLELNSSGTNTPYDVYLSTYNSSQVLVDRLATVTTPVELATTHLLHITHDGAGHAAVYLDCIQILSGAVTAADMALGVYGIGASFDGSAVTATFTGGVVDDAAVYGSVLSLPRMQAHYTAAGYSLPVVRITPGRTMTQAVNRSNTY